MQCITNNSSSYIIVQSPTQYIPITGHRDVSLLLSLECHVWLSSSGDNCYAVHRSLSYGASVWLYRGILPCPILSAKPAYANGICNFRVFGMTCFAGSIYNTTSPGQWTRERLKWKDFPHSTKLQDYWNQNIWCFNVIYRTYIGGWGFPLCRDSVGIFYSPSCG